MSETRTIQIPVGLDPIVAYRYLSQGAEVTVNNMVNPVKASFTVIGEAPYKSSLAVSIEELEYHLERLKNGVALRDALRKLHAQAKEEYNG